MLARLMRAVQPMVEDKACVVSRKCKDIKFGICNVPRNGRETNQNTETVVYWMRRYSTKAVEDTESVIRKARRISAPIGVLAGLFGSLVGVGGGVVISPALVNACPSIPQRVVSGTSLAAVISTATVSASTFASNGCIDVAAAAIIAPAAMIAAPFGARMTRQMNCVALRRALGIFLMIAAPLVPLKAYLLSQKESLQEESDLLASNFAGLPSISEIADRIQSIGIRMITVLVCTGSLAGFASGLLGIGGGTIVTPLLAISQPYDQATVLGTSLLAMIAPSFVGLIQHWRMGNVDPRMALALSVGTAVGGIAGSSIAVSSPKGVLEIVFAVGMIFLGKKTLPTGR